MNKEHSKKVRDGLQKIKDADDLILAHAREMLEAKGGKMYGLDIYTIGALKRSLSISNGFRTLIKEWNLVAARVLTRIQLDTLMRLSAAWLVDNPHEFAREVLAGKRIDKIKDRHGRKLTDRFLVEELGKKYEWMPRVYETTCGYVHLSNRHIFSAFEPDDTEDRSCTINIGPTDQNYPEFSYVEAIDCFQEILNVFLLYIKGWTLTKNNPDIVNKKANSS